jgi:MFS transporter, AAHS family, 4-hydroxybenzoate transporter
MCCTRGSIGSAKWKCTYGTLEALRRERVGRPVAPDGETIVNNRPTALTVNDLIDRAPLSRFQIRTVLLCGIVLVLDGFDAQCIGFLAPPISGTLAIPLPAFGRVFAAGLTGLMLGAMAIGPVADRWGRKWAVVTSTVSFAVFSIMTARITSLDELVILRFLTGLGLGGAMPNVVALSSEYAPKRLQSVFVGMLFAGMPMGAMVASLASSWMIPLWGWRSVFYLGGILPLAVAVLLVTALPESVRFLAVRRRDPQKVTAILSRISGSTDALPSDLTVMREGAAPAAMPVKELFTEGRAAGTVLLWIPFFMNLLILYFIVSWLPGLLQGSSLPSSAGVMAVFFFSLGGMVGALTQGRLMNVFGIHATLTAEFGVSVPLIAGLAFGTASYALLMGVVFVLGVAVQGAQAGINALAADFYPTQIRSTGVGWALGIGRIGSIVGPTLGGLLLSLHWTPRQILVSGMAPALCAVAAVVLSQRIQSGRSAYEMQADARGAP